MALIPFISLRRDVKKISAMLALICGGFYLALADFPVPAVRAYIMIGCFFLAVMLNREAFTLRSLSWAALAILLVQPSSLRDAGFQLSFAATTALVVCYRAFAYSSASLWIAEKPLHWRVLAYFGGIVFSSLVATLATAPFVAWHFQQFTPYGILANMLALPVLSFLVMPCLVLALLAAPLGGGEIMLAAAGEGVGWIIASARWVAGLPGASLHIPPMLEYGLLMIGAGFILAMLARKWGKLAGVGMIAAALASSAFYAPPDIIVDAEGKHVALRLPEGWVLAEGKSTRNFTVRQWEERLGVTMQTLKQWRRDHPGGEPELLRNYREIVAQEVNPALGSHALWLGGERIRRETACDPAYHRPWTGC